MNEVNRPPAEGAPVPAKESNWKTALREKLKNVQASMQEQPSLRPEAPTEASGESALQPYEGPILTRFARDLGIIGPDEPLTYAHFTEDGAKLSTELRVFINSIELSLQKQKALYESLVKDLPADNPQERDWFRLTADMRLYTFVVKGHFSAWGFLLPPVGEGRMLDETQLFNKLEEQRICYGEDIDALLGAAENKKWLRLISVARGIEPVDGVDGSIIEHFKRSSNAYMAAAADEVDDIDYKNLNWLQNVTAGDIVCDIMAPTECSDGITVYNETVKAKPGKPAIVPKGENTAINEEGTALVATVNGHVEFRNGAFHVQNSLNIAGNVDISTGNLDVIGDVVINGNVASGFLVNATGNIVVRGLVEGATLKSDKDIQVGLGVKGNQKAILESKGNTVCKYIESTYVNAGGDVCSEMILNSTIQCGGDITVLSGRGTIIGGEVNARKSIRAKTLGNELNRATSVNAGVVPPTEVTIPQIKEQIEATRLLCDQLQEKIDFIEQLHSVEPAFLKKQQELNLQLSVKKMTCVKLEKQYQARCEEEKKINSTIDAGMIYPSTVVSISGRKKKVITTEQGCHYCLREGELSS